MKRLLQLILFLVTSLAAASQVNGYANVTSITGPLLSIAGANETYDQFNIGDRILVLQMQDDVIGSNTANNTNFGNLSAIANAGKYEVATVALVARVAGIVNLITLTGPLSNTYSTGPNSNLQIITFPTLGTVNYTTLSDIIAVPWNGVVGGVVAFHVNGTLVLHHNILADYAGFRGGAADASSANYGTCNSTSFFNVVDPWFGNKGEGIYKVTNPQYAAGKGKIVNGGGGANTINSGGGGGSNYTGGGTGSIGWSCSSATGGIGGTPLNASIGIGRIFLGGGGGSGEANDNYNNKGGNGGGFVLIAAQEIKTTGIGTAVRISANGQVANVVGNDGAGGGGAGGSVAFQVNTWTISASKPLVVSANGGNGGNVNNGSQHGGGAGGGQGVVRFSGAVPSSNITINSANGIGGENWIGGTRAPGGAGVDNSGIISSGFVILPITLTTFNATETSLGNQLSWITENERAIDQFIVQFSTNGSQFQNIGSVISKGDNPLAQTYSFNDNRVLSVTAYYRLRIVDANGNSSYSRIIALRKAASADLTVQIYPNPVKINPVLSVQAGDSGPASIAVLNMHGAVLSNDQIQLNTGNNNIVLQSVNSLPAGVYNVRVAVNGRSYFTRLVVQK